jgi:hypothetical protein
MTQNTDMDTYIDKAVVHITRLQKSLFIEEQSIIYMFKYIAGTINKSYSENLEKLKNRISNESDYFDMVDLFKRLSSIGKLTLMNLFNYNVIPLDSPYKIKVISDIDNTLIENVNIAPNTYTNNELIPGITPLIKILSKNTTTTLLSARPFIVENISIDLLKTKINREFSFSFLHGKLTPILKIILGKISNDQEKIQEAYRIMATNKFNKFKKLLEIYPHCKFIFFGDDTQGDQFFAEYLVRLKPDSIAFIRKCNNTYVTYMQSIFYHESYLNVAYILYYKHFLTKNDLKIIINNYKHIYITDKQKQIDINALDLLYQHI